MRKCKKVEDQHTDRETIEVATADEHGDDECDCHSKRDQWLEVAEFESVREIPTKKSW